MLATLTVRNIVLFIYVRLLSDGVLETTEAISDNGETQRFTDKEVQAILKQKYNIRTTPQTLSKWRLKQTQPRGRNQIIFDLFKPDEDRWIRL